MDRGVFTRMDALEDHHWWFRGRRTIIRALIEPLVKSKDNPSILEAGCGTGGNLRMLRDFGRVDAFEFDEIARHAAIAKSEMDILYGSLPNEVPFDGFRYNLIGLFDVLEHVEQDVASLAALAERLDEGGLILVTVPAFQFMWSKHDERHHHFRRYSRKSLKQVAQNAGLRTVEIHYFNSFLFPAAIASRGMKKLIGSDIPDDQIPASWVNTILRIIFEAERAMIRRVPLPFGLSLAAVLERA